MIETDMNDFLHKVCTEFNLDNVIPIEVIQPKVYILFKWDDNYYEGFTVVEVFGSIDKCNTYMSENECYESTHFVETHEVL